jgi:hypothetical protein
MCKEDLLLALIQICQSKGRKCQGPVAADIVDRGRGRKRSTGGSELNS